MANGKPGAPKGNRNAANNRGLAGLPPKMVTNQLIKSLKQFERVSEKDPKKVIKRGQAIRVITDQIVAAAVDGDRWAIEYVTERVEGKARQVTEATGQIDHNHSGLQISFEKPIDVTPGKELIEH